MRWIFRHIVQLRVFIVCSLRCQNESSSCHSQHITIFFFILYYFILFALPNICCVFLRNENHNWKWFCYRVWNTKRSSFRFFISRLEFWLNDFPKFGTMPLSLGQLLPTTLIIISTENVRIPCKFESTDSINECYVWSNERCITRKRSFILLILYTENIN